MGAEVSFLFADPTSLDTLQYLLNRSDPGQKLKPIGMKQIAIGSDAIHSLPGMVDRFGDGGTIAIAIDTTPMHREGQNLKDYVGQMLRSRYAVKEVVLGHPDEELHADEATIASASLAFDGINCVVVVGSGTIVDVCKEALGPSPNRSLIVVQTAASVNAFSDDMAVLLKAGVKRTVPSRWPDALLIDLETIAGAPAAMNIAGFGDLMAMWTAPVDWYLAHVIGMNRQYHHAPPAMLRGQGRQLLDQAGQLAERKPEALELLAKVLTLSGISLGVAGSTAPLSGTEHLISHMIDMSAGKRPLALHGAQVAAAAIVVAATWEKVLDELVPDNIDIDRCFPMLEDVKPLIRQAFDRIDPSGGVAAECLNDYAVKLASWHDNRQGLQDFLAQWPQHKEQLRSMLISPEEMGRALSAAGAPLKFADLTPSIPGDTVRWAVANCHLMRNRFTLADFLFYIGWWNDAAIDDIFARAAKAGGGL